VKTEGTLRARVERAADCSPSILVLRHIEALARNTQTLETGKGERQRLQFNYSTLMQNDMLAEPAIAIILQDCLSDLRKTWKLTDYPVLVFATSSEPEKIPQGVLSCFKHEISFEVRSGISSL
jgi:peroxin-6